MKSEIDIDAIVATMVANEEARQLQAMPSTIWWGQTRAWSWLIGHESVPFRDLVPLVISQTAQLEAVQHIRRPNRENSDRILRPMNRALTAVDALWALVDGMDGRTETVGLLPAAAYYSTYHALAAERVATRGRLGNHAAAGAFAAELVATGFLPAPFDFVAVGSSAKNFTVVSRLGRIRDFVPKEPKGKQRAVPTSDAIAVQRVGQALVTTRREGRTADFRGARRAGKPSRHDTTFVDWLYLLRDRAQFQDIDAFTPGIAAHLDLQDFAYSLAWDATAFVAATLTSTAMRMTVDEVTEVSRRASSSASKKAFGTIVAKALLEQRKA